jgi:hypothetical protein
MTGDEVTTQEQKAAQQSPATVVQQQESGQQVSENGSAVSAENSAQAPEASSADQASGGLAANNITVPAQTQSPTTQSDPTPQDQTEGTGPTQLQPPPKDTRMPYYAAPLTANTIFLNAYFALRNLQKAEFNISTPFESFKNEAHSQLPDNIDNVFLTQDLKEDIDYKAYLESIQKLETLEAQAFIIKPHVAVPYLQDIEQKFQHFLAQQRIKFDQNFSDLPKDAREELWSSYKEKVSQAYQPALQAADDLDPGNLLAYSMRYYIKYVMSAKDKGVYARKPENVGKLEAEPRAQYQSSDKRPITPERDKNGKIQAIRVEAWKGEGDNLADGIAVLLAETGEIVPIKIVVPTSNSDNLKGEMDVGIILAIILVAHSLFKYIEENKQEDKVVKALFENGIPLKHISVVNSRGVPLTLSASGQKKLNELNEQWKKTYLASLEEKTANQTSETSETSTSQALSMGARAGA